MRSIAFLTHKGGAGKTTLTAALAVAAAAAGEKVIALDLDSQGSLVRWSDRRKAANAPNSVVIEPLESERLPQLPAIFEGLAGVGFTLAVFDTADAAREHRFSRCDRGRPRRHRVRPRRQGGAGNRGPVALDWRAADARITPL